jgi:hypothetical protein
MSASDPIFSSTYTSNLTNNSSVPLGNGSWGEVEEDPEMRCDDDFLGFLNSHQHPTYGVGPSAPAVNCMTGDTVVGRVEPATGNVTRLEHSPLSVHEDYFIPSRMPPLQTLPLP